MIPKPSTYRDRKYLDSLRDEPCVLTGVETSDQETVDPAHVGRDGGGMGKKTHDYDALPVRHSLHAMQHSAKWGEERFWRESARTYGFIIEFVQAYARMRYLRYLTGSKTDQELIERIKEMYDE